MTRCAVLSAPVLLPLVLCSIAGATGAVPGGEWHFNTLVETKDRITADRGSGYLDLGGLKTASLVYDGTVVNAAGKDPSGSSLGIRGASANGSWFELVGDAAEVSQLSFAYRATATGFDENLVQQWNGSTWSEIGAFGTLPPEAKAGWHHVVFPITEQSGEVKLRFLLGGAESANGVIRFDNVRLEPAAVISSGGKVS